MKLVFLFIIASIFTPALAIAQDAAQQETSPVFPHDKTVALARPGDGYLVAYAYTTTDAIVGRNARDASLKFTADPELYSEAGQAVFPGSDMVAVWRNRVFKSLSMYLGPRLQDGMDASRLMSNTELEEKANERRMATKIVLKETVKYTRERLHEIDRLINALKIEVSNGPVAENAGTEAEQEQTGQRPAANKNEVRKDRPFFKTGLRFPVEGGKISLVSESEARYGNAASFIKINLDGLYDRSAGMTYAFGKDLHLQVERQDTHKTDPLTGDKAQARSSLSMVKVVYAF
jgi:hypothetical protein